MEWKRENRNNNHAKEKDKNVTNGTKKIGKKVKDEQNRKWSKIVGKILKIL